MLFFSLCVVPVDLPICVAETALNRVQPCSQVSLLLVLGENPGNEVEQGIYHVYFYYLRPIAKAFEQCRVNVRRLRSLHIP